MFSFKKVCNYFYLIFIIIFLAACTSNNSNKEFTFNGITIGTSEKNLINTLGEPDRIDESKYGFKWYIYNNDYANYIQIGVNSKGVCGIYTNADNWTSKSGLTIGSDREDIERMFKKNFIGNDNYVSEFIIDRTNVILFYDKHDSEKLTSIFILDTGLDFDVYPEDTIAIRKSFERQLFDITNAVRVRNNLSALKWNSKVSRTARAHSADMAKNDYFDHNNKQGKSPFDRMNEDYVKYSKAGENLAAGQPDPIYAHEELMNSKDHRVNILGDFERLGVGVAFGGSYKLYYTQNFFTP